MDPLVVATVDLLADGHTLLDAEDLVAELHGRVELGLVADPADLDTRRFGPGPTTEGATHADPPSA
jgi:hypothetical protein